MARTADHGFQRRQSCVHEAVVLHNLPLSEPHNLGKGWVAFKYQKAFGGKPLRMLNDAAMQAMIGRNAAVAEIGPPRITLTGFIAFIAWLGVHALQLTTLPARVAACFELVWNYFGGVNVEGILDSPSLSPTESAATKSAQNIHTETPLANLQ